MKASAPVNARYKVMIDDNFHYMDASERTSGGAYDTLDEAIVACRRIVDADLAEMAKSGMTADELYATYTSFGSDPFILADEPGIPFSAWDYARERSQALAKKTRSDR